MRMLPRTSKAKSAWSELHSKAKSFELLFCFQDLLPSDDTLGLQAEAGLVTVGQVSYEDSVPAIAGLRQEIEDLKEETRRLSDNEGLAWCGSPYCVPGYPCKCDDQIVALPHVTIDQLTQLQDRLTHMGCQEIFARHNISHIRVNRMRDVDLMCEYIEYVLKPKPVRGRYRC